MSSQHNGGNAPDIRELLGALPTADQPPMNLVVESNGPMTAGQLTSAFIDAMVSGGKEDNMSSKSKGFALKQSQKPTYVVSPESIREWVGLGGGHTSEDVAWEKPIDLESLENKKIDRDPFALCLFATKLQDHQGELLEICWDLREKLEQARDYVHGIPAWLTLIDSGIETTAELQKIADHLRSLGEFQEKHAKYLIALMDEFNK